MINPWRGARWVICSGGEHDTTGRPAVRDAGGLVPIPRAHLKLPTMIPHFDLPLTPTNTQVYDDVFSEAVKCGPLAGVAVPVPEDSIPEDVECRVYVKFLSVDDAKKLKVCMCACAECAHAKWIESF